MHELLIKQVTRVVAVAVMMGSPHNYATALQAGGRPKLPGVIVGGEGRDTFRQSDPGELGANINVHVGDQRRRIVKRADADEAKLRDAAVAAPHCYLAGGSAMDFVRTAAISRHGDWFRNAGEQDDPVRLDERVEHEGASSLPLAIEAMTAVHEHRQ